MVKCSFSVFNVTDDFLLTVELLYFRCQCCVSDRISNNNNNNNNKGLNARKPADDRAPRQKTSLLLVFVFTLSVCDSVSGVTLCVVDAVVSWKLNQLSGANSSRNNNNNVRGVCAEVKAASV
ncbi:hypothetical protein PAMP_011576 [Pampus punctatissimus]